jgi:hypothetical protein
MALACQQCVRVHAHTFKVTDELFCVVEARSKPNDPRFVVVCRRAINAIPAKARLKAPVLGGVDIHFGFSRPDPATPQWLGKKHLLLHDYRFSLSGENADKYLSNAYKHLR